MNIEFKNFKGMVKINSERMLVAIATRVLLGRHTTGPLKNKMTIVTHFFDKNKLDEEIEKMLNKCLSIPIKETYTRAEKKLVNTLFGFFAATRAYTDKVSVFEQNTSIDEFKDELNSSAFGGYYLIGFEDVKKFGVLGRTIEGAQETTTLCVDPLTVPEIKKFISFLNKENLQVYLFPLTK